MPEDNTQKPQTDPSALANVKSWLSRITAAKTKWKPDFDRMRRNMEFVTGLQWNEQKTIDDDRYTNNMTLKTVNSKVATLYAKNPKAVADKRRRLVYQIWDGNMESLQAAVQQGMMIVQSGQMLPPELSALFADYQQGKQHEKFVQKFCETLEIAYQYQVDSQRPEFKEQVKQALRRAIICGVGYGRPVYCCDGEQNSLSSVDTKSGVDERVKRAKEIVDKLNDGEIDLDNAQVDVLKSLTMSLGVSAQEPNEKMSERIEFDFPSATSIIVDEGCRSLKEFVSARWIAQEYIVPIDEANAIFGVDLQTGSGEGSAKEYTISGDSKEYTAGESSDVAHKRCVALYEVFDYNTKTKFYLCEGYKDYVSPPEPVDNVSGFWHHFALTLNDVESEPNTKASIYPPSDVQLLKHPQKEWNRTREALRDQRNANAPKYPVRKGLLTDDDKEKLTSARPNSVIELEGIPAEVPPSQFIQPMQMARIDPALYDTAPLAEDMQLGAGVQEANIGPAPANVTATVGTIAEQSRMTVSSSNVDDLDGWLSRIAQCAGELIVLKFSMDTIKEVVGPGAVFPMLNREDFVNEVYLKIKAASSGRPNKAMAVANARDLVPLILQAGGNPIGIVEYVAKQLDEDIDLSTFFPIVPPNMTPMGNQSPAASPAKRGPADMISRPGPGSNAQATGPLGRARELFAQEQQRQMM